MRVLETVFRVANGGEPPPPERGRAAAGATGASTGRSSTSHAPLPPHILIYHVPTLRAHQFCYINITSHNLAVAVLAVDRFRHCTLASHLLMLRKQRNLVKKCWVMMDIYDAWN